jgi:hypothetical protein
LTHARRHQNNNNKKKEEEEILRDVVKEIARRNSR